MSRRDCYTAVGRLQASTAALAGFWLVWSTVFNRGLLLGYYVNVLSLFGIVAAGWITQVRMERDFVDRTRSKRPILRFSIAATLLWTSLVAISITYYRILATFVDESRQ